jgi:hypothetical protein
MYDKFWKLAFILTFENSRSYLNDIILILLHEFLCCDTLLLCDRKVHLSLRTSQSVWDGGSYT